MGKILKILKKIKIKNLIILILLLVFNTYAWFIYASKVSTGLTAHVSSWDVEFTAGTGETIKDLLIEVDRIYPGMTAFEKEINVKNKGEEKANLSYDIEYLKVMDETYEVGKNITKQALEDKIKNQFPFKIIINQQNFGTISEDKNIGKFKIQVIWPFETGKDEQDTLWGNKASEYYSLNPGSKSIELKVKLIATQKTGP